MNRTPLFSTAKPAACNTKKDKTCILEDSFLPKGFVPGEHDIVIGRSMKYFNHSGNRALRSMVADRLEEYANADKSEKSFIITEVMDQIRATSNNGGIFLKLDPASGLWYKVGEYLSREKVSQTFRDALGNYRSSSQCKKERRKMERAKAYADSEMRNAKRQRLGMGFTANTTLPSLTTTTPSSSDLPPLSTTSSSSCVEEGSMLDVLATILPSNYEQDPNPLEPIHLKEDNQATITSTINTTADLFEPVALFDGPSLYEDFNPSNTVDTMDIVDDLDDDIFENPFLFQAAAAKHSSNSSRFNINQEDNNTIKGGAGGFSSLYKMDLLSSLPNIRYALSA